MRDDCQIQCVHGSEERRLASLTPVLRTKRMADEGSGWPGEGNDARSRLETEQLVLAWHLRQLDP